MDLYEIRNMLSTGKSIFDLPLRVTYYARVSTEKDEQLNSFHNQISYFENKIKDVSNWTFVSGYWDEGITGTSMEKRDNFNRMVEDAKSRKFDLILTKEVSRFARNTVDTLTTVRELLNAGVGVFFESDNINTLSNEGELRLTIMSSLAQDESRKISERVKFGFKQSVKKEHVLGNDSIWGYKKDNKKLVIVEEEAEIVRKIFELYSTGQYGIRRIGSKLAELGYYNKKNKPFAFSTIKYILTNPKYKGFYVGGKSTTIDFISKQRKHFDKDEWTMHKDEKGYVPAIVDEELWEKCNEIYRRNSEKMKNKETSYTNKYTYSGKIYCKEDGELYWRTAWHKKVEVWQCKKYKNGGRKMCPNSPTLHTRELDFIMKMIFDCLFKNKKEYINKLIETCKTVLQEINYSSKIEKLERDIEKINAQKKNLLKLYTLEKINEDEFEEMNTSLNVQIEPIQNQIADLKEKQKGKENVEEQIVKLKNFFEENLKVENREITRELIDTMVKRIDVEKGDIPNLIKLEITLNLGMKLPVYYRTDLSLLLITHMIRADIETEVSPIVGSEKQSEELVNYLLSEFENDPIKIWESNIFGKNLHELVNEGLQNKLSRMPEDAQEKLQETLERIINEGSGGLICIIL